MLPSPPTPASPDRRESDFPAQNGDRRRRLKAARSQPSPELWCFKPIPISHLPSSFFPQQRKPGSLPAMKPASLSPVFHKLRAQRQPKGSPNWHFPLRRAQGLERHFPFSIFHFPFSIPLPLRLHRLPRRQLARLARPARQRHFRGKESSHPLERHGKRQMAGRAARARQLHPHRLGRPHLPHPGRG